MIDAETLARWLVRGPAVAADALARSAATVLGASAWLATRWVADAGVPIDWLAVGGDAELAEAWHTWHSHGQYEAGSARAQRELRRALFDGPIVVAGRAGAYAEDDFAALAAARATDLALIQLNPPSGAAVRIELFAPHPLQIEGLRETLAGHRWVASPELPDALDRRALDLLRRGLAATLDAGEAATRAEADHARVKQLLRESILRGDTVDVELRGGVVRVLDPSGLQPPLRRFLEEHLGPTNLARQIEGWREEIQQTPPQRETVDLETADGLDAEDDGE